MDSGEKACSGNTVYGGFARGWAKRVRGIRTLAAPAVITDLVVKALKARHPQDAVRRTGRRPSRCCSCDPSFGTGCFDRMLRLALR